jgi:hypothetical protein
VANTVVIDRPDVFCLTEGVDVQGLLLHKCTRNIHMDYGHISSTCILKGKIQIVAPWCHKCTTEMR